MTDQSPPTPSGPSGAAPEATAPTIAAPSTTSSGPVLLELDGVTAGYDAAPALQDVRFAGRAGDRIAILGPNGGGKTTLFRVILRELAVRSGRLELHDEVAIVPQTERSRLDFPVTALDVVLMGTIARRPWWRGAGHAERDHARAALRAVGLEERAGTSFGALSGGQRQRVLVARALVRDARILLLDEPFTGLDSASSDRLHRLIDELAAAGHVLLIATHDVGQARGWDQVLCLNRSQIAFGPPAATLTSDVLHRTYGESLVPLGGDGDHVAVICDHHHG